MKATATAPANIAFIKYWGRKDHKLFLPLTTTNSMNLSACTAETVIEFGVSGGDTITITDNTGNSKEINNVPGEKDGMLYTTLDRVRQRTGVSDYAQVTSKLSFPMGAGIASSAAGMAAFVAAAYAAAGDMDTVNDREELSREIRLSGSVSAARSSHDGFTEHLYGETHEKAYTVQIAPAEHWDLVDLVAVLSPEEKKISSALGHSLADSSPFMQARLDYLNGKPELARQAILDKDFASLALLSEIDTINMHAVMMTSRPPAFYLSPASIDIMKNVISWREDQGLNVFYTFDAGPNPHVITTAAEAESVRKLLEKHSEVQFVLENHPADGVRITSHG
ncbi:MAG: hypothetical protein TR69_WS6001001219 [candidate division WS6 bacterium OLB20]|uniref:diphosphomevalonate decarboxylase n=1 Tax=candidate division WS6 bacterium OLB20 TaxID=1617426 RepID=A0A136LX43_9BACT|nr:MAG: hypothetical protein TR69_WS6001001219 [candidate division WS6 bacterium OLB20]